MPAAVRAARTFRTWGFCAMPTTRTGEAATAARTSSTTSGWKAAIFSCARGAMRVASSCCRGAESGVADEEADEAAPAVVVVTRGRVARVPSMFEAAGFERADARVKGKQRYRRRLTVL